MTRSMRNLGSWWLVLSGVLFASLALAGCEDFASDDTDPCRCVMNFTLVNTSSVDLTTERVLHPCEGEDRVLPGFVRSGERDEFYEDNYTSLSSWSAWSDDAPEGVSIGYESCSPNGWTLDLEWIVSDGMLGL